MCKTPVSYCCLLWAHRLGCGEKLFCKRMSVQVGLVEMWKSLRRIHVEKASQMCVLHILGEFNTEKTLAWKVSVTYMSHKSHIFLHIHFYILEEKNSVGRIYTSSIFINSLLLHFVTGFLANLDLNIFRQSNRVSNTLKKSTSVKKVKFNQLC